MGGTNGCKCAYDKNLSVGYETVVAINDVYGHMIEEYIRYPEAKSLGPDIRHVVEERIAERAAGASAQ